MDEVTILREAPCASDICAIVARDGAVIVERLIPASLVDQALLELRPYIEATPTGRNGFSGERTTRTGALVARSAAAGSILMDEVFVRCARAFLKPWAEVIQLNHAQVIRLLPDETPQPLHRDRTAWGRHLPRDVEPQFVAMVALTDFTADNGATRVVPGSHRWDWDREAKDSEIVQAVMPKGSVMLYSGSVLHGGGANRTRTDRLALNASYALSWLRQEENMYLSCPPAVAAGLAPEMQSLLGYTLGQYSLGYFASPHACAPGQAGFQPPESALGAAGGPAWPPQFF